MIGLIGPIVGLLSEVLKFINTKEAQKYLDESVKLQLDIQKELQKPYDDQDDLRLSQYIQKLSVIMQAAQQELIIRSQSK